MLNDPVDVDLDRVEYYLDVPVVAGAEGVTGTVAGAVLDPTVLPGALSIAVRSPHGPPKTSTRAMTASTPAMAVSLPLLTPRPRLPAF